MKDHKSNKYKPGDHLAICDRTGRVVYASELKEEWNGLQVHYSEWEPRHPRDYFRAIEDKVAPDPPIRSEGTDTETTYCSAEGRDSRPGYAVPGCSVPGLIITL